MAAASTRKSATTKTDQEQADQAAPDLESGQDQAAPELELEPELEPVGWVPIVRGRLMIPATGRPFESRDAAVAEAEAAGAHAPVYVVPVFG